MRGTLLGKFQFALFFLIIVSPLSHGAGPLRTDGIAVCDSHRYVYYSVRPDFRRCISPLCGGYWISRVNSELTRCADRKLQAECYVAEIDWAAMDIDGSEGATLILGRHRRRNFPGFGLLGVLVPRDAWRPANDAPPEGTWYGLKDNGIRCITFPCYNIDQRVLNNRATQTISGVDLTQVGADPADEQAAFDALADGELIAVGENQVVLNEGPAGDGLTLIASQFFLRVQTELDAKLYCETAADCQLTAYHSFVSSPDECYCTLCPVPLNAEIALENQNSWQRNCVDFGFASSEAIARRLICPQVRCVAPMPVECVNNQCVFEEAESILPD